MNLIIPALDNTKGLTFLYPSFPLYALSLKLALRQSNVGS